MKFTLFLVGVLIGITSMAYVYEHAEKQGCERGVINSYLLLNTADWVKLSNSFEKLCKGNEK